MPGNNFLVNNRWMRLLQHVCFSAISFFILLSVFKTGAKAVKVDYVYTGLFYATILPAIYFNLYGVLPKSGKRNRLYVYLLFLILFTGYLVWLNVELFTKWSAWLFPGYFFISYYTPVEIGLFFLAFLIITTLLKLSKSWFRVNELQRKLLESEKQSIQTELKALKAQLNPHFFFNTLNNIYSMSLEKDDRLPGTILQLSEIMRYFLYESKEDTVLLQKELGILQDYIALQKIRSNDKLLIETTIEGEIQKQKIAPLLLITFLENAFKHGAKGDVHETYINLKIVTGKHKLYFKLENNKGKIDEIEKDSYKGLGLQNVKRRLELLYPLQHKLEVMEKEDSFIVQLEITL